MLVAIDAELSAGEMVPDCVRALSTGALDCVRAVEGLEYGGRIECFLRGALTPGRGRPAMTAGKRLVFKGSNS